MMIKLCSNLQYLPANNTEVPKATITVNDTIDQHASASVYSEEETEC